MTPFHLRATKGFMQIVFLSLILFKLNKICSLLEKTFNKQESDDVFEKKLYRILKRQFDEEQENIYDC